MTAADIATPGLWREARRFAAIGVLSTAAYVLLYSLLRRVTGSAAANTAALLVTAVANTTANRRITFGVRDRAGRWRDHAAGLVAFGAALATTDGALRALSVLAPRAGRNPELAVLCGANLLATATRFVVLRAVLGRPDAQRTPSKPQGALEGCSAS